MIEEGIDPSSILLLTFTRRSAEEMLERAAQLEAQALERRLSVFLTLLEPIMILVMGGVVLMIVLAILLPIMEINQLVH